MSRRGYTDPYKERDTRPDEDETTVARREWERLVDRLIIQAVKTGSSENHRGQMRDHEARAELRRLRNQVHAGVRRIESTFWRISQLRSYLGLGRWARDAGKSGWLSVADLEAEIARRVQVLNKQNS